VYTYKIAISLGRILSCIDKDEEKVLYFHASANNASVFCSDDNPSPYMEIANIKDLKKCTNLLESLIVEDTHRPNTKWKLVGNVNANITILRLESHILLGQLNNIPGYMRKRGMKHFHRHPTNKRVYNDNMCFFRCLSYHIYKSTEKALDIFHVLYGQQDHTVFKGVPLCDIARIQNIFNININILQLCVRKKGLDKRKNRTYVKSIKTTSSVQLQTGTLMCLNLYKKHVSLIINLKKYGQVYKCEKCRQVFTTSTGLKRHCGVKKDCTKVHFIYKGGVYRNNKTIFQRLAEIGIHTPDYLKIYPYKIIFDFESYFSETKQAREGNSYVEYHHIPLSASVVSNFPGYEEPKCFIRKTHKKEDPLVNNVLLYVNTVAEAINSALIIRFQNILTALKELKLKALEIEEKALKIAGYKNSNIKQKHPLTQLEIRLLNYINRVPVIGFNSGRYDINLIKREFHTFFTTQQKEEIHTIKRCNQYIAIYTKNCLFLDMFNYLAPGYSYANYLKAFVKDDCKGFFPYEWMDNIRKLQNKTLPPRQAFYSSLTKKTITKSEYKSCKDVWKQKNMKIFQDYLIYYNNKDVAPFVHAISEHAKFFIERGIDMFKDGSTLPGLTLNFLFKNVDTHATPYVLFSKKESDIHALVRKNLVGGPSIIFHRHHMSGVTRIRERLYGPKSAVCRHILGVDANSLYLKCMGEEHCTGFFIVRRHDNNFQPEKAQGVSYSAIEWLQYRSHIDQLTILQQYNYGEIALGGLRIFVDGYVPEKKLIYQFHGCLWHGHECKLTLNTLKTVKGRELMQERAERTVRVREYLLSLEYTVIEQYECQWLKLKKTPECKQYQAIWTVKRPIAQKKLSQSEILKNIEKGVTFGLIQVDIETPENLKNYFSEMTPIFKNTYVSRDDVGPHMRKHLEKTGKLKQPQRQLIGSYFGKKSVVRNTTITVVFKKGSSCQTSTSACRIYTRSNIQKLCQRSVNSPTFR
jgi:G:T-mismatch repair DNA endonuclease (very short patch repair protein)